MLTTSEYKKQNIELKEEHFKAGFETTYGKSKEHPKSFIASLYLLKDVKYDHLKKTGELSESGKTFISSKIRNLKYTDWKKYKEGKCF